jgi:hypothetical protein
MIDETLADVEAELSELQEAGFFDVTAAEAFQDLLLANGARREPRNPAWLDYSEPKNVFTRGLADEA